MKNILINSLSIIVLSVSIFGCDIKDNKDVDPSLSFLKIYDSELFDHAISPVDIVQTEDGGYLMLGSYRRNDTNFLGVYIATADEEGNFVRNTYLTSESVHPVGEFLQLGTDNERYFVSMNPTSLSAVLNQVDDSSNLVQSIPLGVTYPLYAINDGDNQFLVLSYDNVDKNMVLSLFNVDGSLVSGEQSIFDIGAGDGVEEPIIDHFTRTGRQLPFFAGRTTDGLYYLNGFYNYTLSMVFTTLGGNGASGVIQGQQDDGGISQALSLGGNQFAVSRFNFGDNYMSPTADLNTGGTSSAVDIDGNPMLEWINDAPVKMKEITLGATDYIVSASTVKNQQIVLHFYDKTTGSYEAVEYLGFSSPYQMGALEVTADNGLAVLGSTQVAGKFQRLCLFKLSEEDLMDLMN